MKKNYVKPETAVAVAGIKSHLLTSSATSISEVSGNTNLHFEGGSSDAARTKGAGYDVWDEDWSKQ